MTPLRLFFRRRPWLNPMLIAGIGAIACSSIAVSVYSMPPALVLVNGFAFGLAVCCLIYEWISHRQRVESFQRLLSAIRFERRSTLAALECMARAVNSEQDNVVLTVFKGDAPRRERLN